ncbi:hypothetical protein PFZ49_12260 [Microbacterium lacticum]|uniref:hypothetical protein n=1 Tax=Microbacterium lacticum TaxID=33885 RepID=UPI003A86401E
MAGYVGRIDAGEFLDAAPYFNGAWKSFERRTVGSVEALVLQGDNAEYSIFVLAGDGTYEVGDLRCPATPGTAITVGLGASVTITAGSSELDLFITTLSAS